MALEQTYTFNGTRTNDTSVVTCIHTKADKVVTQLGSYPAER